MTPNRQKIEWIGGTKSCTPIVTYTKNLAISKLARQEMVSSERTTRMEEGAREREKYEERQDGIDLKKVLLWKKGRKQERRRRGAKKSGESNN